MARVLRRLRELASFDIHTEALQDLSSEFWYEPRDPLQCNRNFGPKFERLLREQTPLEQRPPLARQTSSKACNQPDTHHEHSHRSESPGGRYLAPALYKHRASSNRKSYGRFFERESDVRKIGAFRA